MCVVKDNLKSIFVSEKRRKKKGKKKILLQFLNEPFRPFREIHFISQKIHPWSQHFIALRIAGRRGPTASCALLLCVAPSAVGRLRLSRDLAWGHRVFYMRVTSFGTRE